MPFVLMSGRKSLNIVNVKKFNIQPLVLSPIYAYRGQQAFYLTEDKDGVNLFFATRTTDQENQLYMNLHCMHLKADFMQMLKTQGRLPEPTTNAYLREIAKNEELKE